MVAREIEHARVDEIVHAEELRRSAPTRGPRAARARTGD